jgi:hypothetical protein
MVLALLAFVATAQAHMAISFPPPLRSQYNPFVMKADPGKVDYSMTSPLSGASQFPCKGYSATDLSDTTGLGASVVTWTQGSSVNFTVIGGATHGGGSCQAALSSDQGKSFKVIHSYIGSCPLTSGQNFDLTIPSDATTGPSLFAWVWYNEIGNREIYMNCASITIAGGSGARSTETVAYSSRPDLFVANLANGCTTIEGQDVQFPDPGPDVTNTPKTGATPGTGFSGTCAAVNGIGGGSSSSPGSSGNSSASAASSPSTAPAPSSPSVSTATAASSPVASVATSSSIPSIQIVPSTGSASGFVTSTYTTSTGSSYSASVAASSTGTAPSATGSSASGLTVTADGQCGGTQTCSGSSEFGHCCSQWGFCGVTTMHCGTGCQAQFGDCGSYLNSTAPARARAVAARRFLA